MYTILDYLCGYPNVNLTKWNYTMDGKDCRIYTWCSMESSDKWTTVRQTERQIHIDVGASRTIVAVEEMHAPTFVFRHQHEVEYPMENIENAFRYFCIEIIDWYRVHGGGGQFFKHLVYFARNTSVA